MHLSSNLSGTLDTPVYLVPTIVSLLGYTTTTTTNHKLSNVCSIQTRTYMLWRSECVYYSVIFLQPPGGSIISSQGYLLHPGDNIYTKNTNPF